MVRAIDANVLQANIGLYIAENAYLNDTPLDILKMLSNWIEEQPTIDTVKHGWWIDLEVENSTGKIFGCSVCNRIHNPNMKDIKNGRTKEKLDYCPNCGTRMDGGSIND